MKEVTRTMLVSLVDKIEISENKEITIYYKFNILNMRKAEIWKRLAKILKIVIMEYQDGYYIVQFLKVQNIDKIDYFILTHCDEDHIGGAYKVLDELQIGTLYMPSKENDTQTYERLLNAIERNNVNINKNLKASKETQYGIGNANWKVLSVNAKNNLNDSSIVIELDYINTKYLFMGDAITKVEDMVEWNEVDVLSVLMMRKDGIIY